MASVYVSSEVEQIRALHPYLNEPEFRSRPIREQIAIQSQTLHAAFRAGDRRVAIHILSWWPKAQGKSTDEILQSDFTRSDAMWTMCREYGFKDADTLDSLGDVISEPSFEEAVDHVMSGEIDEVASRIDHQPDLTTARSRFGHRATLLHYLGANGVETHRQVTPLNAAEIAKLLILKGASKTATADMYGGGQTPYMLATTSAHPRMAGIAEDLELVLRT